MNKTYQELCDENRALRDDLDEAKTLLQQTLSAVLDLRHERSTLREAKDATEARLDAMRDQVRKARLFAGDNLPAATGLALVTMLESAMKGGPDGSVQQ
ncbi:hypothetical protein SAMN02745148_01547 [Modicisalibacter ilicicola DSM 19980]|uniref:Uncharacterized protein n=1 Tax=Modicisalibacter ilicicola DSM 19980 TaxID=1121942 RepID=A0A1M4Y1A1_9GAMM|nr:hypothetical protein [Halomonas ilicicola]SHE99521.1 hypothetical protein SAMN02745148_01547 [Halomonas ilicicola DSM 19980]